VAELLKARNMSSTVNSVMVDVFLWEYRRKHSTTMEAYPYHRVRSIYY
jgi:hypothetical protein